MAVLSPHLALKSLYKCALLLFLLTAALVLKKHRQIDSEVWTFFFTALLFFGGGELAFAVSGSGLALTNFLGFFLRFVAVS